MKTIAQAGGEIGINGEYYKGGQFLPSSPSTIKGEMKKTNGRGTRKEEIAPYTWEVAPADNIRSIYTWIAGTVASWKVYNEELELTNLAALDYVGLTEEAANELVEKWNAGYRWIERNI